MREVAAIDVAGRDCGFGQIRFLDRQLGAVVGDARDARDFAGAFAIEHDDLAARCRWVIRIAGSLAVHAQVARALFNHAVGFAGDDVGVFGEADVERLAGAAQGQRQLAGFGSAGGADRDGTFKRADRATEAADQVMACLHLLRDQRRDNLGVSGDRVVQVQAVLTHQVVMVVDVAVERADHIRAWFAFGLFAVERVRVGLADDADTGPARMAEHEALHAVLAERRLQQRVVANRCAQRVHVVAELADLGGVLVDEVEVAVGAAHRVVLEQCVAFAACAQLAEVVAIGVDAGHDHRDAGGISAAHFEAVE